MKNARTYQPPREEPGISSTWVMIKFGVSYAVAMICAGFLLLLVGLGSGEPLGIFVAPSLSWDPRCLEIGDLDLNVRAPFSIFAV
jgi:hypothetical protein